MEIPCMAYLTVPNFRKPGYGNAMTGLYYLLVRNLHLPWVGYLLAPIYYSKTKAGHH